MRSALLFLFLISLTGALVSQTFLLNGRIRSKEEALPFATVLVKGTSQAINSNAEGDYSLQVITKLFFSISDINVKLFT